MRAGWLRRSGCDVQQAGQSPGLLTSLARVTRHRVRMLPCIRCLAVLSMRIGQGAAYRSTPGLLGTAVAVWRSRCSTLRQTLSSGARLRGSALPQSTHSWQMREGLCDRRLRHGHPAGALLLSATALARRGASRSCCSCPHHSIPRKTISSRLLGHVPSRCARIFKENKPVVSTQVTRHPILALLMATKLRDLE